ncbi:MAG: hypothetical protein LKF96_07690 [Treponema sp.]|jgi:energy-coupling factor transporter transmembrane protein EcfT|nr:hypothetical protein [Treponema sp.]
MALNVRNDSLFFQYRHGNSILHRAAPQLKILLLLAGSYALFVLPEAVCLAVIPAAAVTAALCGFTFREQITDIKPAAYYALLLYLMTLGTNSCLFFTAETGTLPADFFIPAPQDIRLIIRLVPTLQLSSLFFRSTTPSALRTGLSDIETVIRRHLPVSERNSVSETLSLFFLFIPQTAAVWAAVQKAWKARGGKNGPKKIITLFPVLFEVSMHKAWQTERALRNRSVP